MFKGLISGSNKVKGRCQGMLILFKILNSWWKKCGFGIPYAYIILLLLLQKKKSSTAHNMILFSVYL
jgi:hypothetical protein